MGYRREGACGYARGHEDSYTHNSKQHPFEANQEERLSLRVVTAAPLAPQPFTLSLCVASDTPTSATLKPNKSFSHDPQPQGGRGRRKASFGSAWPLLSVKGSPATRLCPPEPQQPAKPGSRCSHCSVFIFRKSSKNSRLSFSLFADFQSPRDTERGTERGQGSGIALFHRGVWCIDLLSSCPVSDRAWVSLGLAAGRQPALRRQAPSSPCFLPFNPCPGSECLS